MNLFYQNIDITTTPVGFISKSATITGKTGIIRKIFPRNRIGIEIIIHMNGIYVVTGYNIGNNHADMLTAFRQGRIEV